MKHFITLIAALSLIISPAIYAGQSSKKPKEKTQIHATVKKQKHPKLAKKEKTYTPITKKMLEANLNKNATSKNHKTIKSKAIVSNKTHKNKIIKPKTVAAKQNKVDKKATVAKTKIDKQEPTQLGLANDKKLDADVNVSQPTPPEKGFFSSVWDEVKSFFR